MRYLILVLAILFATLTRLYHIDLQSIWFDEGWSAHAAIQPSLLAAFDTDPTNPPLYYVLLYLTTRVLGDSPLGLRVVSLFLSLLIIPLSDQLGRRLFNSRAGIVAALLAAVAAPLWWAAQEARMYALLAVLVLWAALAWHQLLKQPTRRAWFWLLSAELLILYTHNTGPAVVLWLNTVTFIAWFMQRRPRLRHWLFGQIVVGLLWLPWFITRFVEVQAANSALNRAPILDTSLLSQIWQALWVAPWEMVGQETLLIVFSIFALVIALLLIPWRQAAARWLVVHVVVLIVGLLIGLTVIGNGLHGRYLVMIVPLLLVAIGAGIARLPGWVFQSAVVSVFVFGSVVNITTAQNPLYQHDATRAMAQYYVEELTADDTMLAWSYADRYDLAYYWRQFDIPAQRVTLPEGADLNAIMPLLPTSGRVAQNIWYTQRADFRGMLSCVLENGTTLLPEEYTVYGMSNRLIDLSHLEQPVMRTFERPLLHNGVPVAAITQVGELPLWSADRAVCIPIDLRLNQVLETDLRARVIIQNWLGWEVASTNVVFATPNQRTTAGLDAGTVITAYALLRLPYGAPPNSYKVLLRVFDNDVAPSGYDMVTADGHLIGKELPLGMWHVRSGADWSQSNREPDLMILDEPLAINRRQLLGYDLGSSATLQPGLDVQLDLLWREPVPLPDLSLVADDNSWQVTVPPLPALRDTISRDWRTTRVPVDAAPGTAHLRLPNGVVLGSWVVAGVPFLAEPPDYVVPVDLPLADIGTLVGFTIETDTITLNEPLSVSLVWEGGTEPAARSYTVFVQLLDADGRLLAQSDAVPVAGERPTTGWRSGEYLVDRHSLHFNETAVPGDGRLIVGMYDSQTGDRVHVESSGLDYLELPGTITVR